MHLYASRLPLVPAIIFFLFTAGVTADPAEKKSPYNRLSVTPAYEMPAAIGIYADRIDYALFGASVEAARIGIPFDLRFSLALSGHRFFGGNAEPYVDLDAAEDYLPDIEQYAAMNSTRVSGSVGYRWFEHYALTEQLMLWLVSGAVYSMASGGSMPIELYLRHELAWDGWIDPEGALPLQYAEFRERFVFSARASSFRRFLNAGSNAGAEMYLGLGLRSIDIGHESIPSSEKNVVYLSLGASIRTTILPLLPFEIEATMRFFPGSERYITGSTAFKLVYDQMWKRG